MHIKDNNLQRHPPPLTHTELVFSYKKHKDNSQTADFCARVKGRLEVVTERLKLHSKI